MSLVATTLLVASLGLTGPGDPATVLTFQDPRIDESSALVDLGNGLMATSNDSGDAGIVYVVDRAGRTVGTTSYAAEPDDTEAMAPARRKGMVWVGDIGDNLEERRDVVVRRVPVGRGDRTVDVPAYHLVYPDGAHDAETLLVAPGGRIYLVTKAPLSAVVYAAPRRLRADRPNRLKRVSTLGITATDGALLRDGRHALVRGYSSAALYTFPDFRRVGSFPLPAQRQGESISVGPGGRIRIGTEGDHSRVLADRASRRAFRLAQPLRRHPRGRMTRRATPTRWIGGGHRAGTVLGSVRRDRRGPGRDGRVVRRRAPR